MAMNNWKINIPSLITVFPAITYTVMVIPILSTAVEGEQHSCFTMVDRNRKIKFIFKLVGAITGACVGISAGAAFKFGLNNIDASIFGYISESIFAHGANNLLKHYLLIFTNFSC
ncbi:hypothetical protein EB796_016466 [Bugula neritina]|uniref:Uncharacterized protein n=1 Tax=Bugula neritina TaxID=10212 RepID=A0A7J7JG71_BUGNE|nr:hypothetical protein EB796_016466 [Bugula neritina]